MSMDDHSSKRGLERYVQERHQGAQLDVGVFQWQPPQQAQKKDSYLDIALNNTVRPVLGTVLDARRAEEWTGYTKAALKLAPLFMEGPKGYLALGGLYASDEAKWGDSWENQLIDGALGLGKAGALKGTFLLAKNFKQAPTTIGLEMGIMNRGSDSLLTRENYLDKNGDYSIGKGVGTAFTTTLRPEMLIMDMASFGAADVVWGRLYSRTRGTAYFNPMITNMFTGATIGVASGGGHELMRQVQTGDIDPLRLIERTATEGGFGALSGYLGGRQAERYSRIDYSSQPGYGQPQKLPTFLDAELQAMRDGTFTPLTVSDNLTNTVVSGKVALPDGTARPALFRPDQNVAGYHQRMQAEVSGYAFGKISGINPEGSPATVARFIKTEGNLQPGYMQSMEGVDLRAYLSDKAKSLYGSDTPQNMLRAFRADTQLQNSFASAMADRMILGEWDNHALNNLVVEKANGQKTVKNIDMQDALKPANHTWDLVPDAGFLRGWDGLNTLLYKDLQGKVAPQTVRENARSFLDSYDNAAGRAYLREQTGWSVPQLEGVMARSRYFAENGVFPRPQQMSLVYPWLGIVKRGLMTGSFKVNQQLDIRRLGGSGQQ